jgi:hypothetical protein
MIGDAIYMLPIFTKKIQCLNRKLARGLPAYLRL